ncbi:MAG: hypothetical protein IT449_13605 [Phycisphaerales bacterium]|nr:hypothetical protein [Phycisphaerales bacterium]
MLLGFSALMAGVFGALWGISYTRPPHADCLDSVEPFSYEWGPFELYGFATMVGSGWTCSLNINEYDCFSVSPNVGVLECSYWRDLPNEQLPRVFDVRFAGFAASESILQRDGRCGFGEDAIPEAVREHERKTKTCRRSVSLPLWLPTMLFSAWPLSAFIRGPLRRRYRRKRGLCLRCGYNLTGLPELRCPECGNEFTLAREAEKAP